MFTKDNPIKLRSYQEEAIRDTLRSFEIQRQIERLHSEIGKQ